MKEEALTPQLLLDYLAELGSALMSAGCPVYRLEALLVAVAKLEGHEADVFAVPTGLFVALRTPEGESTHLTMVRVSEWATDLERLSVLDEVLNEVADRTLSIGEARRRIRELAQRPRVWNPVMQLLATVASSAGAAITFGGALTDAALAGVGALLLKLLMFALPQDPGVRVLENFLGGLVAALGAWVATLLWPGHSRDVLVLAIIIPLLPGMTLTTGLAELTYRNLAAGTSRLMHAVMTLLSLVFGIAMVVGLENAMGLHSPPALPRDPAGWGWQVMAMVCASLGFGVLLGLPREKLRIALASGLLVFVTTALTRPLPGPHAAFLNAFVLAVGSNLSARSTGRPAQLFLMPGMLLLVPGAMSFRSLDTLLQGDAVAGMGGFADVALIAGALVMGLIVANVAVPPRKAL